MEKCRIFYFYSRWYIPLPLGFKTLIQFRETFYVSINQLMKSKASHKGMKSTAYENIFGSPTAASLIAPFLPDAVVSTLQTELLRTVIKITVESDGNIKDICRKCGYGI